MKLTGFEVGPEQPFFLIAGPCVIESERLALETAATLKDICTRLCIPFIFKSSFDKANRSSGESFRGPGIDAGLRILAEVRRQVGVPVLTDVHEDSDITAVAEVVDVLQTPAFLCRQTNFITRVAQAGKPVNIKKGQFLSPWDMHNVVDKAKATGRLKGLPHPDLFARKHEHGIGVSRQPAGCNFQRQVSRHRQFVRETAVELEHTPTHQTLGCDQQREITQQGSGIMGRIDK